MVIFHSYVSLPEGMPTNDVQDINLIHEHTLTILVQDSAPGGVISKQLRFLNLWFM